MFVKQVKWWWIAPVLLGALVWCFIQGRQGRLEDRHDAYIAAAALRHGVDPALVKAVVWRESRFDASAQGTKGEVGLMQISALAAREWADAEKIGDFRHDQLYDPALNTMAGAWYLAKMLRRYSITDNPAVFALADYNAGRTQVLRWIHGAAATNSAAFLERMDYPGTRRYVTAILKRHRRYQGAFPSAEGLASTPVHGAPTR